MSHNDNFKMGGLREDDAGVGMGAAYAQDAEGSAEADRGDLRGLREDDARVELGVSAYDRLLGLREDDARTVLRGAYAPDAEGSAEGDRGTLRGIREDDANLRMGAAYSQDAEGSAEADRGDLRGLREDDAQTSLGVSAYDRLTGLREDDASLQMGSTPTYGFSTEVGPTQQGMGQPGELVSNGRMGGMREDDANVRMGVSAYDRLSGLREDDAQTSLGVSAYDVQKEALSGFTKLVLSGLREDDAALVLQGKFLRKLRYAIPKGADVYSLHRYTKKLAGDEKYEVAGLFDFAKNIFSSGPTSDEYLGTLQNVVTAWEGNLRPNLNALPATQQVSIKAAMEAAQSNYANFEGMRTFLSEGMPGLAASPGRWDRVKRLNAYTSVLQTLISQARVSAPSSTTPATVIAQQVAVVDNKLKDAEAPNLLVGTVLPIAGGLALLGGGIALAVSLAK